MMMHSGNWVWGGSTLMTVALVVFGALLVTAAVLSARYLISSCGTESAAAAGPTQQKGCLRNVIRAGRSTKTNTSRS